ncbi:MAG: hypothetical protein V1492_03265 [Candidatus Micrarchaeota archaeon]
MSELDIPKLLRKTRVGELEPRLQDEIVQLASDMGYERTVVANSNLSFLFDIYQAEKVKKNRSAARLKKAEKMIMKLAELKQEQLRSPPKEKPAEEKRPLARFAQAQITLSERIRKVFNSIGIKDEVFMEKAVGVLGEKKIEERAEMVLASKLDEELVKAVFTFNPYMLLEFRDEKFAIAIESFETKKEIIDMGQKPLPSAVNYHLSPMSILTDYFVIQHLLDLRIPKAEKPAAKKEKREREYKYGSRPMDPGDFTRVIKSLGFEFVRETTHGGLYKNERSGGIMCVQRGHRAQYQLNGSTIKKKLAEARVNLNEFEEHRQRLHL